MTFTQGFAQVVFFIFAIAAVASAFMVITTRNPVKAVLFLVLTFLAMAGVWIFLQAEFLALIMVVVYVGAVMTLFLFVVMMLNIHQLETKRFWVRYLPFALVVALLILIMMISVVGPHHFGLKTISAPATVPADYSNVKALGQTLYTSFVFPFEVAGVLLLVAMVAAITLSFRGAKRRRVVLVSEQLKVKREDRVSLVKDEKHPGGEA